MPVNPVMAAIAKRKGRELPLEEDQDDSSPYASIGRAQGEMPALTDTIDDESSKPEAVDLGSDHDRYDAIRQAQLGANSIANFGNAISQAARGANAPTSNDDLYKNLAAQNAQQGTMAMKDLERSSRVKQAIEARKSKDAALAAAQADKQKANERLDRRDSETARHNRAMEYAASQGKEVKLAKNRDADALPEEDREVVKDLAKKNASKIAIANQIEAVMNGWDDLPEDQKVAQGRQLIKVLNSTEGADAVGTEEAKRLGGKLEFAMGNLFNSNPTQFGRDLSGFKEQAKGTAASIRSAVHANDSEINNRYRRHGIDRTDSEAPPKAQYAKRGASDLISEAKAGSGRVTVSNGKEKLSIELKHLPDALKDGYQVIK